MKTKFQLQVEALIRKLMAGTLDNDEKQTIALMLQALILPKESA